MKTFSSILPLTRRFGMQGTCITNGVQGGGSETAEKGGAVQSFLLIHNPHMDAENFEPLMQAILAGKPALTSSGGWSVGKVFNIKPYDRLFFYRSAVKPTGIFAVGTALPADTPEARKYRRITPVPVKPGLAVYEGPHWKNENETAYYVNAQWTMLINPEMLVPFERLRDERPFSRVFSVKGRKRGKVPQASGWPIHEIADDLYEECKEAFCAALRARGHNPAIVALSDEFSLSSQMAPEERRAIENAAVNATELHYHALGCKTESRELDRVGWDLDVFKGGEIFRRVEVKGTKRPDIQVELTPNEYAKSEDKLYRLAVVRNALDSNPACAIYTRNGNEWLRVCGEESGSDKSAPARLEMEEKIFAVIRQPD